MHLGEARRDIAGVERIGERLEFAALLEVERQEVNTLRAAVWVLFVSSIAACGVFSPVTATATFFHHSCASFG